MFKRVWRKRTYLEGRGEGNTVPRKTIEYYLKQVKDPASRRNVKNFYEQCRGKLTLDSLNEHSWNVAIRELASYENTGYESKHHEELLGYYKSWLSLTEEEKGLARDFPWDVGSEFSGGEPIELTGPGR